MLDVEADLARLTREQRAVDQTVEDQLGQSHRALRLFGEPSEVRDRIRSLEVASAQRLVIDARQIGAAARRAALGLATPELQGKHR